MMLLRLNLNKVSYLGSQPIQSNFSIQIALVINPIKDVTNAVDRWALKKPAISFISEYVFVPTAEFIILTLWFAGPPINPFFLRQNIAVHVNEWY